MTLFVSSLTRNRVAILTDTAVSGSNDTGSHRVKRGNLSKVFPIPHIPAVLFGRGSLVVASCAAIGLNARGFADIDDAPEIVPGILDDAADFAANAMDGQVLRGAASVEEQAFFEQQTDAGMFGLVGWSAKRGRFLGYAFTGSRGAYKTHPMPEGVALAPSDGLEHLQAGDGSIGHLSTIIKAQYRAVLAGEIPGSELHGMGCGGPVVAVEMTPQGMNISTLDILANVTADTPMAAPQGLNRQQRRAAERAAQKQKIRV